MPRKPQYVHDDDQDDIDYDCYDEDDFDDEPVSPSRRRQGRRVQQPSSFAKTVATMPRQRAEAGPARGTTPSLPKGFDFSTPSPDTGLRGAQAGQPQVRKHGKSPPDESVSPPPGSQPACSTAAGTPGLPAPAVSSGSHATSPAAAHTHIYADPAGFTMDVAMRNAIAARQAAPDVLHVVVLGHVDAGKSTLMGRLVHKQGSLEDAAMRRHLHEAQKAGQASFGWAWVLDERPEERSRGVTVDVGVRHIRTPRYHVVLLDAPGHKDFVPAMISGAAQADAALLLVDGSVGGFEAGFASAGKVGAAAAGAPGPGQTREHVHVARSLGIKQLAVVVTKLDTCKYSQQRFEHIRAELEPFLASCGYRDPQWLPASPLVAENVTDAPQEAALRKWWPDGRTVVDAIDSFAPPARLSDGPLRLLVSDPAAPALPAARSAVTVSGKLLTGALSATSSPRVLVLPSGVTARVKAVGRADGEGAPGAHMAVAGEAVEVALIDVAAMDVASGSVLCSPGWPVHVAACIKARLLVLNVMRPIVPGQRAVAHIHVVSVPCRITQLHALVDRKSGTVEEPRGGLRMLRNGQVAEVQIELNKAVCMDTWAAASTLSKLALRIAGSVAAVGSVIQAVA